MSKKVETPLGFMIVDDSEQKEAKNDKLFHCEHCTYSTNRSNNLKKHNKSQGLIWHNSKRAGFIKPSKFQLRKKSSPHSSPSSSFPLKKKSGFMFSKSFLNRFPEFEA